MEIIDLYHGSKEKFTEINDGGTFGGIFAGCDEDIALAHGDFIYKIELDKSEILTQYVLSYLLDYKTVKNIIIESLNINIDEVEEETFDKLWSVIVEDKSIFDLDDASDVCDLLNKSDLGEASWKGQKIRGVIAKHFGYKAVTTRDEHGTTYLVLPGVEIKELN
jgi:hypothetical protein